MSSDRGRIAPNGDADLPSGLHIDRETAARERVPEDLDASVVGPYRFPDTRRRLWPGIVYGAGGIAVAVVALGSPAVPDNMWVGGALLVLVGLWCVVGAWPLRVDQEEALVLANRTIGFPVGHAVGVLGWRGWRSRPTWRVIVFSAEDPPQRRGLVEIDGVTGEVLGSHAEDNPDWPTEP